jgi:hypothetical protein
MNEIPYVYLYLHKTFTVFIYNVPVLLGLKYNTVLRIRIRDPGSGAFLPPGSGSRMDFSGSRISDPAPFLMKFSYNIFRIHVMLSL